MKIFFSAGEPSGDVARRQPDSRNCGGSEPAIECVGYGGPEMAAAGCQLHADLTALAVMWFLRVLLNLHKFLALGQPGRSLLPPSAARCRRADRLSRLQLVDRPAGQGARHSGVLLLPAANLGLGKLADQEDAAVRRPRAVQLAVRGNVVPPARLPRHVRRPSVFRRSSRASTLDRRVSRSNAPPSQAVGDDFARLAHAGSDAQPEVVPESGGRWCRCAVPGVRFAVAAFKPHQAQLAQQMIDAGAACRSRCSSAKRRS